MARWPTLSRQLTVVLARQLIVVNGTLGVNVKFEIFEHTSSIKKAFIRNLIESIVNSVKWFCFSNGPLADLVKTIECL